MVKNCEDNFGSWGEIVSNQFKSIRVFLKKKLLFLPVPQFS